MEAQGHRPTWKTLLAFSVIYFVWGSSFLAIRVGVREVPPFILAAMRFLIAGLVLYGWMIAHGERSPSRRQWMSASLLAVLIFVFDYGLLFWAEQRVPSGVADDGHDPGVHGALRNNFPGNAEAHTAFGAGALDRDCRSGGADEPFVETERGSDRPGERGSVDRCRHELVNLSVRPRKLQLPPSKVMSSGAQMLLGGVFLTVAAAALGEFRNFHPAIVSRGAWSSLLYLIVAASIIGFTAYVWLIHHESPTKVGTYAYVNPVVAVLVGYFLGGEALGLRIILGTGFVLIGVVVITTTPKMKSAAILPVEDAPEVVGS